MAEDKWGKRTSNVIEGVKFIQEEIAKRLREIFQEIVERYKFEIDTMG